MTPEQIAEWSDSQCDWGSTQSKVKRLLRRFDRLQAAKAIGTHTPDQWKILHDVFGRCVVCDTPYEELSGGGATKDHIVPLAAGGCDCLGNLQPACRHCNSRGIGQDLRDAALPGWQTIFLHRLGAFF